MSEEDKVSEQLSLKLAATLKKKMKSSLIKVENRKDVFIGSTCGVHKGNLKLFFQSAEQDIIVCLNDENNQYVFEGSIFFKKFYKSLRGDKILIPLVIFEVKYKKVGTHTVRHYSELARMIKSIFPFCMYNFLLVNIKIARNQSSDRIYMSAKHFDKVIHKINYNFDNEVEDELVTEMFNLVSNHLDYLRNENYFRLNGQI